jgi:transposase InsO family protein
VKRKERSDPDLPRMQQVLAAYTASHQTYGYRRIGWWLAQKQALVINHKAVLRLMNKLGIRSIARKRNIYRKMSALETAHHYPNRLKRDFSATQPNQKWVTDVTYIHTCQGWGYLSIIKDLYDGFIVAHQFGSENSVGLVTRTLQLARQKEKVTGGLILHSDQGHQYSSLAYFALTSQYSITPSMSRRANPWDNASMENFFSHLKEEALRHLKNPTLEPARQVIDDYVYFYNYERIQLKTRQTPFEYRCLSS